MALHLCSARTNINAPLPGTYDAAVPGSGVFPLSGKGPVLLMESSGLYTSEHQFIANVNTKVKPAVSLFGFSRLESRALSHSNTDGIGTSPANPYNFSASMACFDRCATPALPPADRWRALRCEACG